MSDATYFCGRPRVYWTCECGERMALSDLSYITKLVCARCNARYRVRLVLEVERPPTFPLGDPHWVEMADEVVGPD